MNVTIPAPERKPLPPKNAAGHPAVCKYCTADIEFVRGQLPEDVRPKFLVLNRDGTPHHCRKDPRTWRYR